MRAPQSVDVAPHAEKRHNPDVRAWLAPLIALALLSGCTPPGACVSTYTTRRGAPADACRQDLDAAQCRAETPSSVYTPGSTCADVGFPCAHDALWAVLSERKSGGVCPPSTTEVR